MKGFPLEFGIGARGPECFYDDATRWLKKFYDRFSCFDTIPAVTDGQTDRQMDGRTDGRTRCVTKMRYTTRRAGKKA